MDRVSRWMECFWSFHSSSCQFAWDDLHSWGLVPAAACWSQRAGQDDRCRNQSPYLLICQSKLLLRNLETHHSWLQSAITCLGCRTCYSWDSISSWPCLLSSARLWSSCCRPCGSLSSHCWATLSSWSRSRSHQIGGYFILCIGSGYCKIYASATTSRTRWASVGNPCLERSLAAFC